VSDVTAPASPVERRRRRRAALLLEALLLAALMVRVGSGLARAIEAAAARGPAPAPLDVDVSADPAWRLALLRGIGPSRAEAIVRDREARGPPRTLEDLDRVRGIGPGTLEGLRSGRPARAVLGGEPGPDESPDR
jgi:competence protein ComEA